MLPWGGVLSMTLGRTQDTLEGLCVSAGRGTPRDSPEELGEVAVDRKVWAPLLRLLTP